MLEGTKPSNPNPSQPTYEEGAPDPPIEVKGRPDALKEWKYIMPLLREQRVITKAFRAAVAGYCGACADVAEWERVKRSKEYRYLPLDDRKIISVRLENARKEVRQWITSVLGLSPTTVGKASSQPVVEGEKPTLARVLDGTGSFSG